MVLEQNLFVERILPGGVLRWAPQSTEIDRVGAGKNLYPFDPTRGPGYLAHCHILDHEAEEGASTPMLLARSRHASVRSLERYARPAWTRSALTWRAGIPPPAGVTRGSGPVSEVTRRELMKRAAAVHAGPTGDRPGPHPIFLAALHERLSRNVYVQTRTR